MTLWMVEGVLSAEAVTLSWAICSQEGHSPSTLCYTYFISLSPKL